MLQSRLRPLPRRTDYPDNQQIHSTDSDDEYDAEGLFTSFLPHLFPDEAPSFHGDSGQTLLYSSSLPQKKELEIMVPGYPDEDNGVEVKGEEIGDEEDGRRLFAHLLWSAALLVAEGVESVAAAEQGLEGTGRSSERMMRWSVKGQDVLELGAGTGLPSIVSLFADAASVTITDHPLSSALGPNGAIRKNLDSNVPEPLRNRACIHPHEWGELNSLFAQQNKGAFTRIIAADCLWVSSQHKKLVNSILWFLSGGENSRGDDENNKYNKNGRVWVVAGFHTGRRVVGWFFETAVEMGLEVEAVWERDVNATMEGGEGSGIVEREWIPPREGESRDDCRRWCVVAVLKRKGDR